MSEVFTPIEKTAWSGFLIVHERIIRQLDADMQDHFHISLPEFEVLSRLSMAPENRMRMSDLAAESVLLSRSGMSRLAERLERVGLVMRTSVEEDRRGSYTVLTPAGHTLIDAAHTLDVISVRRRLLSLYTEQELIEMGRFWTRFLERDQVSIPETNTSDDHL